MIIASMNTLTLILVNENLSWETPLGDPSLETAPDFPDAVQINLKFISGLD